MDLFLVQLPTSHHGAGERVYPLGLSRLSGLVPPTYEKSGFDMNLSPDPWPELGKRLTELAPKVVALSLRNMDPLAGHQVSYLSSLRTAARLTRRLLPSARILAGGPAFSLFGERLMEQVPEIDLGLRGEGEKVFKDLIAPELAPEGIPGLIRREGGRVLSNPLGAGMEMSNLPPMDLDLFNPDDYTGRNAYVAAVGIEGKRGCDLSCGYCVYPCLGGAKMRLRPPREILDEIEMLHGEYGIGLFHFTDSVVNRPADHFAELTAGFAERNLNVSWTGFFREDTLDRKVLDRAVKSGLVAVYFSADALTDHGLRLLGKRMSKDDILEASRITVDCNILTMCHFLVNLPGETKETEKEAWEMLDRLLGIHGPAGNLGAMIFNHVRLYPGAPLTRRLIKKGALEGDPDLLYPVYHNPPEFAHMLHEMEAHCHERGVFSRLKLQ